MTTPVTGSLTWCDLTVPDAAAVRDFYASVVGWTPDPVGMGEYDDYGMLDANGTCVAGVCHARGRNADLPPQWLVYIAVDDVDAAAQRCQEAGGTVVVEPRALGEGRMCVVRDPAGAVCALYHP